jgi:hypothetical protein
MQLHREALPLAHLLELGGGDGQPCGLLLSELGQLEWELLLRALRLGLHLLPSEEGKKISGVVLHHLAQDVLAEEELPLYMELLLLH